MADDPNVRLRDPEKAGRFRPCLVVVEGHDDNGAFTLAEALDAASQLTVIDLRHRRRIRDEVAAEHRQQLFLPPRAAPQIDHDHAAGAQDEVGELVRFSQSSCPKGFQYFHEHLLDEVVRGSRRSQVAETIEPNPRRHAAAQLGFGLAIAGSDARCEVGVVHSDVHRAPFYWLPSHTGRARRLSTPEFTWIEH
jgi:hypothetical protein